MINIHMYMHLYMHVGLNILFPTVHVNIHVLYLIVLTLYCSDSIIGYKGKYIHTHVH